MELSDLQKQSFHNSFKHGFWELTERNETETIVATKIALIHSEVSEALEEVRKGKWVTYEDPADFKLHGLPSELADVMIRVADLAEWLGIDLSQEIERKAALNKERPFMHGKSI